MISLSLLHQIPLGSLKRYLDASGWRRRKLPSGIEVFSIGPADDDIEIILPAKPDARDIFDRLASAVRTLTALEGRDTADVVASIRAINVDLIRTKLPETAVRRGTIPLPLAEVFIRQIRKILTASAHTTIHDSPFFSQPDELAEKYADHCRFGHTFSGSFGLTVESPVGPNTPDLALAGIQQDAVPFERRTLVRFARGLKIAHQAVEAEDPSLIVANVNDGLNANGCESLADLLGQSKARSVEFEIVFSYEWGAPPDLGQVVSLHFQSENSASILRDAADRLRPAKGALAVTIYGLVTTLHSTENPSDLFSAGTRDVIVEWKNSDIGKRNVRVPLTPELYLRAVDAHKSGRPISVSGSLIQGKSVWRLENISNFSEEI